MWRRANRDNDTLKITEGNQYFLEVHGDTGLVSTQNNIDDYVVLPRTMFDEDEE